MIYIQGIIYICLFVVGFFGITWIMQKEKPTYKDIAIQVAAVIAAFVGLFGSMKTLGVYVLLAVFIITIVINKYISEKIKH